MSVKKALCADTSNEAAESLAATASRIDHWILVEYRGLWDRDVLDGSLLSAGLKEHLRDQLARLPHSRLLFVKQPERRSYGRRQLFFGSSRPGEERFFGLEFDSHEDLLSLDFTSALRDGGTPGVPVRHPLYVVCTHGKRDRCCAKYGQPLYEGLRREAEEGWVWQSTHVGGDRFAGNVVCLPHGLYYGRVADDDLGAIVAGYEEGQIHMERYRGRSHHTFVVQAADRAVREATGLAGIEDVAYESVAPAGEDAWLVRMRAEGGVHEVEVVSELGEAAVHLTCGAVTPQRARRYAATSHRLVSG